MNKGIASETLNKGITPVVATILLLMITISITGVSFVFMQRSAQTAAQSGEQQLSQQAGQIGSIFSIEGADKNNVYIKNMGARSLNASSLNFYVNNVLVESNSIVIAPGTVGTVALNDSKLAMLPDPAELKVTSASFSDKITADFYGRYAIAYWKFDEGSGSTAMDSSGNGNDFNLRGSDTWTTGKEGMAIKFVNGWTPYTFRSPATVKTVSMWFKTIGNAGTNICFTDGNNQGNLCGYTYNSFYSGVQHSIVGNGQYNDGNWHFVAVSEDSTDARISVDGNPPVIDNGINYVMQNINSGYFNGGCDQGCGNFDPDITIDEVRILKVARSMGIA